MAVTDEQVAGQAAAMSNPITGASGGTAGVSARLADDYLDWLFDNGSDADAWAALLAAAASVSNVDATLDLATAYLAWIDASTLGDDPTRGAIQAAAISVGSGVQLADQVTGRADDLLGELYELIGLDTFVVSPASATKEHPNTQAFVATATYNDGFAKVVTADTDWASSAAGVATISAAGLATTVAAGASTITGTWGEESDTSVLTVTDDV